MSATLLADAVALFGRHRDLLLRVAAPWLYLPAFALALLVPPPPPFPGGADEEVRRLWAEALVGWTAAHGGWYLLAHLVGLFGVGSLYALLLTPDRPTVAAALGRAFRVLPRLALASLLTAPAVLIGLSLWLVPGLYLIARLVLVGPALVAERPLGVLAAIGASVRRTRGHGLVLTAAVAVPLIGGWLAGRPLLALDRYLREGVQLNPVALAMVDAGAAAVSLAAGVAQALVAIAAYRRLAR